MTDQILISEIQLQKILGAIQALKGKGIPWDTVVPVFISAALAMCVGVALDYFKSYREKIRELEKRQTSELNEITVATVAIKYNLELIVHLAFQIVLPHHSWSHNALALLDKTPQIESFVEALNDNGALMRAPTPSFSQYDFISKLPFVVEEDPEFLGQANWLKNFLQDLVKLFQDRNSLIEQMIHQIPDVTNLHAIGTLIQAKANIDNTECITTMQALEQVHSMAQTLERIGRSYKSIGQ